VLIAHAPVVAEIATAHGFTKSEALEAVADADALAETRKQAAAMAGMGIGGVPFFVFDRRLALSGAQPEPVFADAIAQAASTASS